MAEHFSFFDAVLQDDGTYEEEYQYNAQRFTNYFKTLVTTGVMKGASNMLAVSASGSNMVTKVNTGIAFIEGRYYENDSFKDLTHDTETLGVSRIDRIVVRMDLSTEARYVKAFIKKGVPSTNPVPPTLTQTPNLYEISLAQVRIVGGQTFIATNAITDERGKDVICPWAGSNILPNFDNEELQNLVIKVDGLYPLTEGNGYAKSISGTDLNTVIDSGLYVSIDGTMANNFPKDFSGGYNLLINNTQVSSNWTYQTLTASTFAETTVWKRARVGGTWNKWEETYPNKTDSGLIDLQGGANWKIDLLISSLKFREVNGVVTVRGFNLMPQTGYSNVIFTLPVGYRPTTMVVVSYDAGGSPFQAKLLNDGKFTLYSAQNTTLVNKSVNFEFTFTIFE